jgi:hypothetical protein
MTETFCHLLFWQVEAKILSQIFFSPLIYLEAGTRAKWDVKIRFFRDFIPC